MEVLRMKLSNTQVVEIKKLLRNTNLTRKEVAKMYNVSISTIDGIIQKRTHVNRFTVC